MGFTSWIDERYACKQQSPLALMAMGLGSVTFVVNKGLSSNKKESMFSPSFGSMSLLDTVNTCMGEEVELKEQEGITIQYT